ncbi:LuxR family transcriptional regulator [Mycobacterium kiyosense]|nr:LuxR family transcriptional regulator [Mycobacterium kiyosense]GLB94831.1 LuxR family transcriptional regulator [Mycobacterium kiyosense]GLC01993.1 LuxR family transcriptional regulator [Mycobacterium kiyosense]GLC09073.1 LuxR family transcriptional regulator [Mycobacterium kiyosense]GLC19803.1 LuxR family transcriptional regulator [Mycobacterium kiyosense]
MLASMSADTVNWSDLGVNELPTGTVTLLLADIEGSTRLWETQPEQMASAVARLDRTLGDLVTTHHGVRPIEQGEGDSFVIAFSRAADAVACAVDLQRAPLQPIRLRIGMHTGDVQLRDPVSGDANYVGPAINRAGRLRDLAHGGQTVLSSATEAMVLDNLPAQAWLTDLGTYRLRDLPRPEQVLQLCHPELGNEFPPLRTPKTGAVHNLPAQLTSFIGRGEQLAEIRRMLGTSRLVTLTGAGGVGKTRLAIEVAGGLATEPTGALWFVDLAPIADSDIVAIAAARALGLPDQPGRSTTETLVGFIGDRQMLIVLDNCEHLLDATAALVGALLSACAGLRLLVTSREPIGVAGEAIWRVPSLSLNDEAVDLFVDRARLVRPEFRLADQRDVVCDICSRLDGMPLAIELAAARVRALSVDEIRDSLHDRFRLLTGTTRAAVRRQQTLRASVDWSHALLTESERVLFRRLAAFVGGFDLAAVRAVAGGSEVERYQVLDQLTLLVDKSLVVAESPSGATRYRMLETVRQYALEKLGESGEGDDVRARHRDHYLEVAASLENGAADQQQIDRVAVEIDNLRAVLAWSVDQGDSDSALRLASALVPLWLISGRVREALMAWFDAALGQNEGAAATSAVRARALADRALLHTWAIGVDSATWAEQAVTMAREIGDPALLARALTACGVMTAYGGQDGRQYFDEAFGLARPLGDKWLIVQLLGWQTNLAFMNGDVPAARKFGEEGEQLAEVVGDRFTRRQCCNWLGWARTVSGDLAGAIDQLRGVEADAEAAGDGMWWTVSRHMLGLAHAYRGDLETALGIFDESMPILAEMGDLWLGNGNGVHAAAMLAAGEVLEADRLSELCRQQLNANPIHQWMHTYLRAEVALAQGDPAGAHRWADESVSVSSGWYRVLALEARTRVAIARGEYEQAERDAHEALSLAANLGALLGIPDIFELLAILAGQAERRAEACRLFGAAAALRQRMGAVRFKVHDAAPDDAVARLRDAFGDNEFDVAYAEGAAMSTEDSIAYAQRGRGERRRPSTGWASLTPTECAVVGLVSEGLGNKAIAARLFVSLRTVESHLTHVYTKLGLSSRVQLVQEAARHS